MVIQADDMDLTGVIVAIALVVLGIPALGVALTLVAVRFGVVPRRPTSFLLGVLTTVALVVDVIVSVRVVDGDATGWDVAWAAALTAATLLGARRLLRRTATRGDDAIGT